MGIISQKNASNIAWKTALSTVDWKRSFVQNRGCSRKRFPMFHPLLEAEDEPSQSINRR